MNERNNCDVLLIDGKKIVNPFLFSPSSTFFEPRMLTHYPGWRVVKEGENHPPAGIERWMILPGPGIQGVLSKVVGFYNFVILM
ncbi:MAG: hypothetical protein KKH04_09345 [Proteobacteria bacterium]|nr:hypothetical protein [Pseudomonadota bacterium]